MFGSPGLAYVYLVYGMYHCLNIVTEPEGRPAAVLVRAVEPLEGIDEMRAARLVAGARRRAVTVESEAIRLLRLPANRLASGPGLVAASFGIERADTGLDLCDPTSPLHVEPAPAGEPPPTILATPRIGIAYAAEPWATLSWRFVIAGHPSASGPATLR